MKHHCVILLLLSVILCGPGCRQAQEEPGSVAEKSAVQEQDKQKTVQMPEKRAEAKPKNSMKLDSEDAKLKIVSGGKTVVGIELENRVPIRGVQFLLEGVKITDIRTTARTVGYLAKFNEAPGIIIRVDMSGKKIPPGTGPIAEIVCDKAGSARLSDIKLAR